MRVCVSVSMSVRFQADGAKFVAITCPPFQAVGIYLHKLLFLCHSVYLWDKKFSCLIKIGGAYAWRVGGQEARGPPQLVQGLSNGSCSSFLLKQKGTELATYSYSGLLS